MSIDAVLPAFNEIEETYGLTDGGLPISLTITLFFAAIGLGNLFWGPIADRYGRSVTMQVSLGAVVVGAFISSFAPSFEIFLTGRVLWGLAAAGPTAIVLAITRDCYEGDDMARIMSLTQAVFLIVPILAPGLGELLLKVGSWRLTTLAGAVLAMVGSLWFRRINETLKPADVLPLEFGRVSRAAKAVVTNRATALFTLAALMTYGSFFPWLASSPKLFGDIYDRDTEFALFFGGNAIVMALVILLTSRLVRRFGTFPVLLSLTVATVAAAAIYVVVALTGNGVPGFWVWFGMVTLLTALNAGSSPLFRTLAMQPMGAIAGTAASVTGAIVFLGGSVLGWLVDRAIDDTVTPFGLGFLVYGSISLVTLIAVRNEDVARGRPPSAQPSSEPTIDAKLTHSPGRPPRL